MYWPKFSIKKLGRCLSRRRSLSGASCSYVRWTKYVGLKMYSERGERTTCWRRQKKAAARGLGPKVGECFEFRTLRIVWGGYRAPDLRWTTIYCYWTEHVQVNTRLSNRNYYKLQSGLEAAGIVHEDLVPHNTGTTRQGNVVCIDFDTCSCRKMVA